MWVNNYDYGLVTRGFVGTVLTHLLKPFYTGRLNENDLNLFVIIINIIFYVSLFIALLFLEKSKKFDERILLTWVLSPLFITYFIYRFGHIEIILIICFILALILFKCNKFFAGFIICNIGILVYEQFSVLSLPFLVLFLMYKVFIKRINIILFIIYIIEFLLLSIYIHFYGRLNHFIISQGAYCHLFEFKYLNFPVNCDSFSFYAYSRPNAIAPDIQYYHLRYNLFIALILLSPYFAYIISFFLDITKKY